jgi:DNA-binding CsgD family transcriptional regulator
MDSRLTNTATALVAALQLAEEHGSVEAALRAAGLDLRDIERFEGLDVELDDALALGFLAGRVGHDPHVRRAHDPTSFVMDRDLVVQRAEGESIMRLPWFEDDLFVGRQIPDIAEMPFHVRDLCTQNYTAALGGEHARFGFTSFGHAYAVEALPVRAEDGGIEAVLAVATPERTYPSAAAAYERTAERLMESADLADKRADLHQLAGRTDHEAAERESARRARAAAARATANAARMQARSGSGPNGGPPNVTAREIEVLVLASHGLTYQDIADQLTISVATVRTHLQNIFVKLGASDKAAAVATALRHGLIE